MGSKYDPGMHTCVLKSILKIDPKIDPKIYSKIEPEIEPEIEPKIEPKLVLGNGAENDLRIVLPNDLENVPP